MQTLPGFRDFLPEDCAKRNYTFARWREVARRYAFVEWEGPVPRRLSSTKRAALKLSISFSILRTKANAKSRCGQSHTYACSGDRCARARIQQTAANGFPLALLSVLEKQRGRRRSIFS